MQCTPKCGTVAVVVDSVSSVGRIIHSKRKENCGLLKKGWSIRKITTVCCTVSLDQRSEATTRQQGICFTKIESYREEIKRR